MSTDVSETSEITRARKTLETYHDTDIGDFLTASVFTSAGVALEAVATIVEFRYSNLYLSVGAGAVMAVDGLFSLACAKEVFDTFRYSQRSARDIKEFDSKNNQ